MQPIEIANLTLELTMQYFTNKSLGCAKDIILSGYVSNADRDHNVISVTDGSIILKIELNSLIEEADS